MDGLPVAFGTFLVGDGGTCVREQQRAAFHTADSLSQEHQGTCHSAPPVAAAVGRCSQMVWHKQPHIARSWLTLACPLAPFLQLMWILVYSATAHLQEPL